MAFSRNAARMRWLLIGPLALQPALLSAAFDAAAKGLDRSAETLLAQAPGPADDAIPKEVQGWADGAVAAYTQGDPAAGVAWLQANRPALDIFGARAFINLGTFLNGVGQQQEALTPTEESVGILRQLEGSQPEALRFLAMALTIWAGSTATWAAARWSCHHGRRSALQPNGDWRPPRLRSASP